MTYEHRHAGVQGLAKQGGVGGTHVQQEQDVRLGRSQVQLGQVHQARPLNEHELDEQQGVVVTHRLQGQVGFCALQGRGCKSWGRKQGVGGGGMERVMDITGMHALMLLFA